MGLRAKAWLLSAGMAASAAAQDGAPAQVGRWGSLINAQVVPIHNILLPSGKVLYFDRHDHGTHRDRLARIWNPVDNSILRTPDPGYDLFCSGHSYLRDGRILITGGHVRDYVGEAGIRIYDPMTNTFDANLPRMNAGRWYPSNATLPNGDVLILSGDIVQGEGNPIPQVYQARTRTLRTLDSASLELPWYPFLYVASETRAFMAGPQPMTRWLDLRGRGRWIDLGHTSSGILRNYGSSVMYEPGKVLICGGDRAPPSASAEIIDLNAPAPKWAWTDSMAFARRMHTATLLPDGKVLVTGGTSGTGFNNSLGAVLTPEVWDPATGRWTRWAPNKTVRIYHSFALLLPDGRVLTGGGGHPSDEANGDRAHPDFEIFEPPYLFKGPRPVIEAAPDTLRFGEEFLLRTAAQGDLQVSLLKLAAVTHAFNQNQNFNRLPARRSADGLLVRAPKDSVATQPGPHLLFLLDGSGVPSVGRVVWVEGGGKAPSPDGLAAGAARPGAAGPGGWRGADGRSAQVRGAARQVRFRVPAARKGGP